MNPVRRVFISDIHMCNTAAVTPQPGKQAYGWLSAAEAAALGEFLRSDVVTTADQLFLVGDLVDLWAYPVDVKPPTALEILQAPHNQPVVSALRSFASQPGKQIIYLTGNHDFQVDASFAKALHPKTVFSSHQFVDPPLVVAHGHETCFFNAPDPGGRTYPLGYFITRCTSTGDRSGTPRPGFNLWTLFHGAPEVVQMIGSGKPFADAVLDVVMERTSVGRTTPILMPDGTTVTLDDVRRLYATLTDDWKAKSGGLAIPDIVLSEWDPFNGLTVGNQHLHIRGHSHTRVCATNPNYGVYVNLGSWCTGTPNFAVTFVDDSDDTLLWVTLGRWDGTAHIDQTASLTVTTGPQ